MLLAQFTQKMQIQRQKANERNAVHQLAEIRRMCAAGKVDEIGAFLQKANEQKADEPTVREKLTQDETDRIINHLRPLVLFDVSNDSEIDLLTGPTQSGKTCAVAMIGIYNAVLHNRQMVILGPNNSGNNAATCEKINTFTKQLFEKLNIPLHKTFVFECNQDFDESLRAFKNGETYIIHVMVNFVRLDTFISMYHEGLTDKTCPATKLIVVVDEVHDAINMARGGTRDDKSGGRVAVRSAITRIKEILSVYGASFIAMSATYLGFAFSHEYELTSKNIHVLEKPHGYKCLNDYTWVEQPALDGGQGYSRKHGSDIFESIPWLKDAIKEDAEDSSMGQMRFSLINVSPFKGDHDVIMRHILGAYPDVFLMGYNSDGWILCNRLPDTLEIGGKTYYPQAADASWCKTRCVQLDPSVYATQIIDWVVLHLGDIHIIDVSGRKSDLALSIRSSSGRVHINSFIYETSVSTNGERSLQQQRPLGIHLENWVCKMYARRQVFDNLLKTEQQETDIIEKLPVSCKNVFRHLLTQAVSRDLLPSNTGNRLAKPDDPREFIEENTKHTVPKTAGVFIEIPMQATQQRRDMLAMKASYLGSGHTHWVKFNHMNRAIEGLAKKKGGVYTYLDAKRRVTAVNDEARSAPSPALFNHATKGGFVTKIRRVKGDQTKRQWYIKYVS